MPRLARVKLNHATVQEYLNGQHGIREDLVARAERVLAAAKADPHDDTYAYEDGLQIQESHSDRLQVKVVSTDGKGNILEAKYGILARALDAAGGA